MEINWATKTLHLASVDLCNDVAVSLDTIKASQVAVLNEDM